MFSRGRREKTFFSYGPARGRRETTFFPYEEVREEVLRRPGSVPSKIYKSVENRK